MPLSNHSDANFRNTGGGGLGSLDYNPGHGIVDAIPQSGLVSRHFALECGMSFSDTLKPTDFFSSFRSQVFQENLRYHEILFDLQIDIPGPLEITVTSPSFTPFITLTRTAASGGRWQDSNGENGTAVIMVDVSPEETGPFILELTSQEAHGTGDFTINIACNVGVFNDMLTSAVYHPTREKIFGARGGFIFQYSKTGVLELSKQFAPNALGDCAISYDADRDWLICPHWWYQLDDQFLNRTGQPKKGIYVISPNDLSTIKFIPWACRDDSGLAFADITPNPLVISGGSVTTIEVGQVLSFDLADLAPIITVVAADFTYAGPTGVFAGQGYWLGPERGPFVIGPFDQKVRVHSDNIRSGSINLGSYTLLIYIDGVNSDGFFLRDLEIGETMTLTFKAIQVAGIPTGDPPTTSPEPIDMSSGYTVAMGFFDFRSFTTGISHDDGNSFEGGPRRVKVLSDGTWVILEKGNSDTIGGQISHYDVVNDHIESRTQSLSLDRANDASSAIWYDLFVDEDAFSGDGAVWVSNATAMSRWYLPALPGSHDITIYAYSGFPDNFYLGMVYGFDYCPTNGKFYTVTGTDEVATALKESPETVAKFTLDELEDLQPTRIRYIAFKDRLYIPTLDGNTVIELNPATNTVTNEFTGFNCPYEIFATNDTVWAVQLGGPPLKIVTT